MASVFAVLLVGTITVTIDQAGGLSTAQLQVALGQMADIWRECGIEVTSRRASEELAAADAAVSLRIVKFSAGQNGSGDPVLAWVGVGPDHSTTPLLYVSLPAVTAFLAGGAYAGRPVKRLPPNITRWLVARAIGRVAAHELGHYVLQRGGHQPRGLMRATYSADDLLGEPLFAFRFSAAEREAAAIGVSSIARSQHAPPP